MGTQTTEGITPSIPNGKSTFTITEDYLSRYLHSKEMPPRTDLFPEYLDKSCALETESAEEAVVKMENGYRETIREWWVGFVLKVHWKERYFEANLKDITNGIESIAEFDIDTVFEDNANIDPYLFPGAEFAFFVVIRHGRGSPETVSRVEFTSPYIWRKEDNKKVKELFSELFPDDPPLQD